MCNFVVIKLGYSYVSVLLYGLQSTIKVELKCKKLSMYKIGTHSISKKGSLSYNTYMYENANQDFRAEYTVFGH